MHCISRLWVCFLLLFSKKIILTSILKVLCLRMEMSRVAGKEDGAGINGRLEMHVSSSWCVFFLLFINYYKFIALKFGQILVFYIYFG